ncbi:hypothetical protein [Fluviispira sanaruensis]|uniref:Uncharacterized protein n=1 Tax=Fluviispira sanaruensis TaxID=2493639 RepID=A0A4P2VK07_FLUSA|nr:hypothetical protein [Fluviispira sanaruensis]BBH53081.1 hypothetical protein JCM31447_15240 [Fluviispira sanaruensis]
MGQNHLEEGFRGLSLGTQTSFTVETLDKLKELGFENEVEVISESKK